MKLFGHSPQHLRIGAQTTRNLDLIRGMAAIAVMIGHVRGLLFVEFQNVTHPTPWVKALYLGTSLGRQAVMVFFVLSGFLISASVLRAWMENRWSWSWYLQQ